MPRSRIYQEELQENAPRVSGNSAPASTHGRSSICNFISSFTGTSALQGPSGVEDQGSPSEPLL